MNLSGTFQSYNFKCRADGLCSRAIKTKFTDSWAGDDLTHPPSSACTSCAARKYQHVEVTIQQPGPQLGSGWQIQPSICGEKSLCVWLCPALELLRLERKCSSMGFVSPLARAWQRILVGGSELCGGSYINIGLFSKDTVMGNCEGWRFGRWCFVQITPEPWAGGVRGPSVTE